MFFSPEPHLFFKNILPVDRCEELVAHHFFGIVWTATKPVNKTKTPSPPTHQLPFLCTDNCANTVTHTQVQQALMLCCSLLTCIYQFQTRQMYSSFPYYLQVHVLVRQAVLNVLILAVLRLFPETLGLDQNNNQLCPCLWPLPCDKTNQEGTKA